MCRETESSVRYVARKVIVAIQVIQNCIVIAEYVMNARWKVLPVWQRDILLTDFYGTADAEEENAYL